MVRLKINLFIILQYCRKLCLHVNYCNTHTDLRFHHTEKCQTSISIFLMPTTRLLFYKKKTRAKSIQIFSTQTSGLFGFFPQHFSEFHGLKSKRTAGPNPLFFAFLLPTPLGGGRGKRLRGAELLAGVKPQHHLMLQIQVVLILAKFMWGPENNSCKPVLPSRFYTQISNTHVWSLDTSGFPFYFLLQV